MKKLKSKSIVTNEIRPELFNFHANKGKNVMIALKNDNSRTGILLGLFEGQTVKLENKSTQGQSIITETPFFDISDVMVLDN